MLEVIKDATQNLSREYDSQALSLTLLDFKTKFGPSQFSAGAIEIAVINPGSQLLSADIFPH